MLKQLLCHVVQIYETPYQKVETRLKKIGGM
jgi:hypothetical protein